MSGGQPDQKTTNQSGTSFNTTSGQSDSTTQQNITPEQRVLLDAAIPNLLQYAATPPTLSNRVAPTTQATTTGYNLATGAIPTQQGIVGSGANASQFLTSGEALDPRTNPGLAGTIDAAVRPIYQNLTESVLPSIRGDSAMSSSGAPSANYGGSRQGIAEGIATRGASTAAGDVAQKTAFSGYTSALDAMTKALGLVPSTAGAQTIPAGTSAAVGDAQQAQAQSEINASDQISNYNALLPFLTGSNLLGLVNQIPGGGTTSTGTTSGVGTGTTSGTSQTTGTAPQSSLASMLLGGGSLASGLLGSGGLSGAATGLSSILPFL